MSARPIPDPFASIGTERASDAVQARFSREADGNTYASERMLVIPKDEIAPDPANPRGLDDPSMSDGELDALRESIESGGQQVPIIVTARDATGRYQLVAGHRRLAAVMRSSRVHTLKAILRDDIPPGRRGVLTIQLLENAHRPDINPVSDALAVASLVELYDNDRATVQSILGLDRGALSRKLLLAGAGASFHDVVREYGLTDTVAIDQLRKLYADAPDEALRHLAEAKAAGNFTRMRQSLVAARAELASGEGKRKPTRNADGGPTEAAAPSAATGRRGRAPTVRAFSLDESKGGYMLRVEIAGESFRFTVPVEQVSALREMVSALPRLPTDGGDV